MGPVASSERRDDRRVIVEGLGAMAVSLAETGEDEDTARRQLVGMMLQLHETDVEVLREAAEAIASFPQPIDESADELERARPIREMLGVRSASEDLEASLRARDWLERLANDLDSASDG